MTKNDEKSDKLVLIITDKTIRIKKNNFIKKWFSREYRTEKTIKEFAEAGYPVGEYELSVEDFMDLCENKLSTHKKVTVKKAVKIYEDGIESIEVGRNTKRDRKAIRKKIKKKGFELEGIKLLKSKDNKKVIEFVSLDSEDTEEDEDLDW